MRRYIGLFILALAPLVATLGNDAAAQQKPGAQRPGFFISSSGSGNGADLGGLAGADKRCQALAKATGAGNRTWRAYLSTTGAGSVNARDRIGTGPWYNVKGVQIAQGVADLHSDKANINNDTALDEQGRTINSQGAPNRHDILTGSSPDGRAIPEKDMTCGNWTRSGEGSAMVGHHDRTGLDTSPPALSWNSSHASRGCSQDALRSSGGDGLFYCFAVK